MITKPLSDLYPETTDFSYGDALKKSSEYDELYFMCKYVIKENNTMKKRLSRKNKEIDRLTLKFIYFMGLSVLANILFLLKWLFL